MTVKAVYLSPSSSARCEFCLEEFFHLDECWSGESGRIAFAPTEPTDPLKLVYAFQTRREDESETEYMQRLSTATFPRWHEVKSGASNDAFPEVEMGQMAAVFEGLAQSAGKSATGRIAWDLSERQATMSGEMIRQALLSHSALVDLCVSLRTKLRENGIGS